MGSQIKLIARLFLLVTPLTLIAAIAITFASPTGARATYDQYCPAYSISVGQYWCAGAPFHYMGVDAPANTPIEVLITAVPITGDSAEISLGSTTTLACGEWYFDGTIPASAAAGEWQVTVRDGQGWEGNAGTITIIQGCVLGAADSMACRNGTVTLNGRVGGPGDVDVTMVPNGYSPARVGVGVLWLGSTMADAQGNWTLTASIPDSYMVGSGTVPTPAGSWAVYASSNSGSYQQDDVITVLDCYASDVNTLPSTGFPAAPILYGAALCATAALSALALGRLRGGRRPL